MPLILRGISKKYGGKWALRNLSFSVAKSEVFGVFGPSGAGKSTLLRVIGGTEPTDGGEIRIDAAESDEISATVVPSRSSNGGLFKRVFGSKTQDQKPSGLSRVSEIEAAISGPANVILLDNPFCELDDALRASAIERIRDASMSKGLITILASADYRDMFEACDRIAILINAECHQVGTPFEIYDSPASASVAAIVGRNNLFAARRLTSNKAELPEFKTIAGEHRLFTQKVDSGAFGPIHKNTTLAIRPENIAISFGASFPEDNLLKATIKYVRPLGPTTLVGLESNGLEMEAMVPRLVGLDVNDECMIGLPPEKILVLKD